MGRETFNESRAIGVNRPFYSDSGCAVDLKDVQRVLHSAKWLFKTAIRLFAPPSDSYSTNVVCPLLHSDEFVTKESSLWEGEYASRHSSRTKPSKWKSRARA
jgi:hypothetical protein